jgi:hypothetical protein
MFLVLNNKALVPNFAAKWDSLSSAADTNYAFIQHLIDTQQLFEDQDMVGERNCFPNSSYSLFCFAIASRVTFKRTQ